MEDILDVTLLVAETLERLDVPYVVGGSLASSFHGIPRATIDTDLVAAVREEHRAGFVEALRDDFYLDPETIRQAIERRASFNVVHLETMFKVDVFVAPDDPAARRELERGRTFVVTDSPRRILRIASAEDTIAHKLHWYELGDEMADRRWSDAIGVLKVAGARGARRRVAGHRLPAPGRFPSRRGAPIASGARRGGPRGARRRVIDYYGEDSSAPLSPPPG